MDRLTRSLTLCGFGLLLTASGCRMTRPEVPPGRPYSNDGRQRPAIGFSSDGHPVDGAATTNMVPDSSASSRLGQGIGTGATRPDMSPLLGGAGGSFGPPGTSGRPNSTAQGDVADRASSSSAPGDDSVLPAGAPSLPRPSIEPAPSPEPTEVPATLPPDAVPRPGLEAPASQTVQPTNDGPGQMSRPNNFPSPM